MNEYSNLVGKEYIFSDNDKIKIFQIKRRDDGDYVTYLVHQGPGIPRKLVMPLVQFLDNYGHLFGVKTEDI